MSRSLTLRAALVLVTLFAATLALIGTQPQDNEMRAFIIPPPGCPMPCWQGIRPGLTSDTEALAILKNHPWGGEISTRQFEPTAGSGIISWMWGDHLQAVGKFRGVRLRVRDHIVWNVMLPPGIPLYDIWHVFGQPDEGDWAIKDIMNSPAFRLDHTARYLGEHMLIHARLDCPARLTDIWNARTTIQLGEPIGGYYIEPDVRISQFGARDIAGMLSAQRLCAV